MTGNQEHEDVESRLRASLRAYADVVDVEPGRLPGRAGDPQRSSGLRRWRSAVLAAAAVLAVAGGTWAVVGDGNDPSSTAASGAGEGTVLDGDARAGSAPESVPGSSPPSAVDSAPEAAAGAAAAGGALSVPPTPEVGVSYPFDLYTHCGVLGADVGGIWFAADPPLVEDGNPPEGWGNPYQRGTLTLESTDAAVFRDDAGHELTLRAAPESERPPICA